MWWAAVPYLFARPLPLALWLLPGLWTSPVCRDGGGVQPQALVAGNLLWPSSQLLPSGHGTPTNPQPCLGSVAPQSRLRASPCPEMCKKAAEARAALTHLPQAYCEPPQGPDSAATKLGVSPPHIQLQVMPKDAGPCSSPELSPLYWITHRLIHPCLDHLFIPSATYSFPAL